MTLHRSLLFGIKGRRKGASTGAGDRGRGGGKEAAETLYMISDGHSTECMHQPDQPQDLQAPGGGHGLSPKAYKAQDAVVDMTLHCALLYCTLRGGGGGG